MFGFREGEYEEEEEKVPGGCIRVWFEVGELQGKNEPWSFEVLFEFEEGKNVSMKKKKETGKRRKGEKRLSGGNRIVKAIPLVFLFCVYFISFPRY